MIHCYIRTGRAAAAAEAAKQRASGGAGGRGGGWQPDPMNPTEMQAYFIQEVQLGEELLAEGHLLHYLVNLFEIEKFIC